MNYLFTLLTALFLLQTANAQRFVIEEFRADPTDLAARRYEKRTVNDEPSAIIKVITNIRGMRFDSNLGIVDVEHRDEGYWIYIAPRERRVRLLAEGFLPQDVNLPEPAQSYMVYSMIVTSSSMMAPPTDLVRITFRMNQENVYIRSGGGAPVPSQGRNAVFNVEKGEHDFRFIKDGFEEVRQSITAQEDMTVDITLSPGQVTSAFEPPGFITVTSSPPGAEVFLNEQRVGITPYTQSHISGQYSVMLRHTDYHDHFEMFQLEAGASMNIPAIELKPRFGYWQIGSSPVGAEVYLDGKLEGTTPLQRAQISSGQHELTVRLTLYHEHKESFIIEDGDEKAFSIALKPAFGTLKVTSDPTGATLYIDGREAGTTPYENSRQPSGRYNLRLTRDLHADAHESVVISDGEATEQFVVLAMNYGTLQVAAAEAEIFLNGNRVGTGSYTADLPPGQYTVKANKSRHADDEREVFIRLGQTESITLSPAPRIGSLAIASEPFETHGAEIWIDGQRQDRNTPAVLSLLEGNYEVRLRKKGYADAVDQARVVENQTTNLNLTMLAGLEVTINSEPAGAELYIDDNLVGRTPFTGELSFGSHQLKLVNQTKTVEETITINQGGQSRFNYNVVVIPCRDDVTFTYRGRKVTYGSVVGQNGTCWMDRNLGASRVARSYNDSEAYGDLFQWGRGDDGHQLRNSITTSTRSRGDNPGHVNFITVSDHPRDWHGSQNDGLWQGDGGINDVCPVGWRVPTASELEDELSSWSSKDHHGAFASPLKLVAGGFRLDNGPLSGVGSVGTYWSSSGSGNSSHYIYFHSGDAYMFTLYRVTGRSVRCIRD